MFDLHCHLLPGIDDGPETLEVSLDLARMACANGITHSVLTPHIHPGRYKNTRESIEKSFVEFRQALVENDIPLKIGFAGEVRLSDEILLMVQENQIPFYGEAQGYKIMLLELPHNRVPAGSDKLVEWLISNKIRPIIAHPERNKDIMRSLDKVRPFLEMECFLQVTAGSVAGLFGEQAKNTAQLLLETGCVTILASDAHNLKHRPPELMQGVNAASEILGEAEALKLVTEYPRRLCSSQFS